MSKTENKKAYGREELKKYFKNGNIPSENHFGYLIESMLNKQDDGISKDEDHGLHIYKSENSNRLITFFNNLDETKPFFQIEKDNKGIPSLKFSPYTKPDYVNEEDKEEEKNRNNFFFHEGGRLGIGKRSNINYQLDVNGFIGMKGRVGTYRQGEIAADGTWHTVISNLDNCQAFEIVARSGSKGKGKFAMIHAIALSTYGRSRNKIRKTRAHYGFFWNKLNMRWKGDHTHKFHLQLRTNCNYGAGVKIYYSITKLWDDELMLPEGSFY